MNVEADLNYKTVSTPQRIVRGAIYSLSKVISRSHLQRQPEDSLLRLEGLAAEGYGSLIVLNHFSKGDPQRIIFTVAASPVLRDRPIIAPIGVHQYKGWNNPLYGLMGLTVYPITTTDTEDYVNRHPEEKPKYQQALTRKGYAELLNGYYNHAIDTLSTGGVVILFPQGGRRSSLDNVTTAVSSLINRTNRAGVDRFAVMFMGVGMKGLENYQDEGIRGLNMGSVYEFTPGRVLTKVELTGEARERGITVDQLTLEELKLVVPPSYLPRNQVPTS